MLNEVFDPSRIKLDLESTTKTGVFGELVGTIALPNSEFDRQKLLDAITERESKMSTNILPGIAIPHGYCSNIQNIIGAIGISRAGIEFGGEDQNPVHLVFMLLMGEKAREKHLQVLSQLWELINSKAFAGIRRAKTPQEVYDLLCCFRK